ncbi:Uncharacterised protein [Legionella steigerwaltii]|uniref:Uncharacterized protein n=2 Tax=Legionella steigerwaltii TaxID=460 RepID=A0A378L7K6_9GAMM|nr:hypothetical protein [Legionella steigerwaltii]KTD76659.1 hypothetical protein Lstg_2295 [Legionella steigerwaltii]STY22803.1 Uncharacterised protein [Legionella steigerwaltii]
MTLKRKTKKIKNQETFAYGTHIEEIPGHRLLILDDYAFDIEELNSLSEKDLFTNMHTQTEFSEDAKKILLSNKLLREKIQGNLPKKQDFPVALLMDVYNLGLALLQTREGKENIEAPANFSQKLDNIYSGIKKEFLNFTIKMSSYNYRVKATIISTMQVRKLLADLSAGKICVRTGGNWLIQLVHSLKPDIVNEAHILKLNQEFVQATPLFKVKTTPKTPAFFTTEAL